MAETQYKKRRDRRRTVVAGSGTQSTQEEMPIGARWRFAPYEATRTRESVPEHPKVMGRTHLEETRQHDFQLPNVDTNDESGPNVRHDSGDVVLHGQHQENGVPSSERDERNFYETRQAECDFEAHDRRFESGRSGHPQQTVFPYHEEDTRKTFHQSELAPEARHDDRVEECFEVGRGEETSSPSLYSNISSRNHCRLAQSDQKQKTIYGVPVLCDSRTLDEGDLHALDEVRPKQSYSRVEHDKTCKFSTKGARTAVRRPFDKEGSSRLSGPTPVDDPRTNCVDRKAQECTPNGRDDSSLFTSDKCSEKVGNRRDNPTALGQGMQRGASTSRRHTIKEEDELEEFLCQLEELTSMKRHSLTRRPTSTRVAKTSEDFAKRLHLFEAVGEANLDPVLKLMRPKIRNRFNAVWRMTFGEEQLGAMSQQEEPTMKARVQDAEELGEKKVCRKVDESTEKKTAAWVLPFTVLEDKFKDDGMETVRRFICWTRIHNENLKHLYKANVPLAHVSNYLKMANKAFASTLDLRASFWQVAIPEKVRHFFRFRDDAGNLWELCRLPMGHVCAPELMHTLVATLAGHPDFSIAPHAATRVEVAVWIDNIDICGEETKVTTQTDKVEALAKKANFTFGSKKSGREVEFIGVHFNHEKKTVAVGKKAMSKLEASSKEMETGLTMGGLERLVARLLHASAILSLKLPKRYFILKMTRRRLSRMSRGLCSVGERAHLSPSAEASLKDWVDEVRKKNSQGVTPPKSFIDATFILFTDATLDGHGAVLINQVTNQLWITGGKWPSVFENINVAEMKAVTCALSDFAEILRGRSVSIYVDNTSVQWGIAKACSKSEGVSEALLELLDKKEVLDIAWEVKEVRSGVNPADPASRGDFTSEMANDKLAKWREAAETLG